jgi:hypothetical protein
LEQYQSDSELGKVTVNGHLESAAIGFNLKSQAGYFLVRYAKGANMGDKGSKKNKDKNQKQQASKHQQKDAAKQEKSHPKKP